MIAHVKKLERSLEAFAGSLFDGMGRPERRRAMAWYLEGLLLDGTRKSIEPMAARLVDEPAGVEAMRQRLQQCVSVSAWSDDEVRARLAGKVQEELPGIEVLVLDDTGFPKQGKHSVGVARQYSGTLGRTANCQVAVSLHLAGEAGSCCIGMQLYLPDEWTSDPQRCRRAGVPQDVGFLRKWEIALRLLDDANRWAVAKRLLLVDAGYGEITEFREALTARGYSYIVGMGGDPVVWAPGTGPVAPADWRRPRGHSGPTRTRYRDGQHAPVSLLALATALGRKACRSIRWREGTKGTQHSGFAAVRGGRLTSTRRAAPRGRRSGFSTSGLPTSPNRPSSGSPISLPPPRSGNSSGSPSFAGGSSGTIRTSRRRSGSITSRAAAGGDSTTTSHCALPHTPSSRSTERFPPRRAKRWTLPMVRRHLQLVLLRRIGWCPLCRKSVDAATRPRGPSRM